jgi:hypothetical protein
MLLLTGLVLAVVIWGCRHGRGDERAVLIDVEGHGREEIFADVDLSHTVLGFTSVFPARLDPGRARHCGGAFRRARAWARAQSAFKEATARHQGQRFGYGLLRYLNAHTRAQLAGFAAAQIGFNYLGRFDTGVKDWSSRE